MHLSISKLHPVIGKILFCTYISDVLPCDIVANKTVCTNFSYFVDLNICTNQGTAITKQFTSGLLALSRKMQKKCAKFETTRPGHSKQREAALWLLKSPNLHLFLQFVDFQCRTLLYDLGLIHRWTLCRSPLTAFSGDEIFPQCTTQKIALFVLICGVC